MYSIIKRDNETTYNVNEYMCDSVADLNSLPRCAPGSLKRNLDIWAKKNKI